MLTREQLSELTILAISRAFAGGVSAAGADFERRLDDIIARIIPDERPDWRRERPLLFSRVLAAVTEDGSDLIIRFLPSLCQCEAGQELCAEACPVGGLARDEHGVWRVDPDKCINCELCADACDSGAIVRRTDVMLLARMALERQAGQALYAILAPSFIGQFGRSVSDGQVRAALRRLGFTDAYEVALAADITTMREADEYIERHDNGERFMITSCCCPAFVKLVEKRMPKLTHLVSHSVSPMVALGRLLKQREPGARVVFIGPCLAKKAESRLADMRDAVDLVLTFKETDALLRELAIAVTDQPDRQPLRDASHDGRVYAHTGGVSEAIVRAIKEKRPELEITLTKGNGLKQCQRILEAVDCGEVTANFMEGMGCPGGCIGGPGTVIPVEEAAPRLLAHADDARCLTASENSLAQLLGESVEAARLRTEHE